MRTGSRIRMRVQKRLCVSVYGGKPSIYFLVNIGYFPRSVNKFRIEDFWSPNKY